MKHLNYLLEIKTKDPISEDNERIIKRHINLAVWKVLDELPDGVDCSVYSIGEKP
jgi:hypothetical protein